MFKIILIVAAVFLFRHFRKMGRTVTAPTGQVWDLFEDMLSQAHLLVAGATGSGKSVAINGLLNTLLYRLPNDDPGGAQLILIDPKLVEFAAYKGLPHVIECASGYNPDAWMKALNRALAIMDWRKTYMGKNKLQMYDRGDLYVVIDEWASIYKNKKCGKAAYEAVLRLISEGRAERVHLIMATQIPKADIIPTEIRENFPARLCLFTNSAAQSRLLMGKNGCEDLPDPKTVGKAKGFYVLPGKDNIQEREIPYVRRDEINRNIAWWMNQCA